MAQSTSKTETCFLLLVIVGIGFCSPFAASDAEAQETVQNPFYVGGFIVIATVACAIVILFGCASFCPRRTNFKNYDTGPDAYFNDVTIGRPPAVDFAMYPPVESTPAVGSLPVYFEPLPDPSKLQQQRQTTSPVHSVSNANHLRPKIMHANSEAMDNEGDCDIVDGNFSQRNWAQQEKLKLDRLLGNIQRANTKQQFPRSQLQYIRELGSGWFGKVLQGEGSGILPGHKKTKVVVQMLKDDADQHDQYSFLMEGSCYREIDSPNVLKLIGQCIETTPYLCILELCPLGDLKSYLRSQRSSIETLDKQGLLLNFVCDMAAGLQALHQAGYVHRDFAARNCLINADMIVKVGDYGLSEEIYKDDYYFDSHDNAVPVRWLAPESVRHTDGVISLRNISKESNLWSFGVALWEVFTCGSVPYGDLSNDHVLRLVIDEGCVRLSKPDLPLTNVDRLFQLMEMCWHTAPGQRASLRELRIMLLHLRSAVRENPSVDFDQKWNQLMPRRIVTDHIQPRSAPVDVHAASPDAIDVDLGTLSGSARPVSFESDFSVTAQAGSLQPSVWSQSASATPDSTCVQPSDSGLPDSFVISSPVNEMSLAAELGVFDTTFGCHDDREGIDINCLGAGKMDDATPVEPGKGTPKHFSVHADVHSENIYAVEYKGFSEQDEVMAKRMENGDQVQKGPGEDLLLTDAFDSDLLYDNSDQFASLTDDQNAANRQQYAAYLQTVATVDGDEIQSFAKSADESQPRGNGDNGESVIGDSSEFAQFYKSLTADAGDVAASEDFLGDDSEFAKYYTEHSAADGVVEHPSSGGAI